MYKLCAVTHAGFKNLCYITDDIKHYAGLVDPTLDFEERHVEHLEILGEYNDMDEMRYVCMAIADEYYTLPPKPIPNIGAWISPYRGDIFSCGEGMHAVTASLIGYKRYKNPNLSGFQLEKMGWLHVLDNGVVLLLNDTPTPDQINSLSALMLMATDELFKKELSYQIRRFK